jgi:cytochrome b6
MTILVDIQHWIEERFEVKAIIAPLVHKTVPIHRLSYWYLMGGMTLFLFGIQVCTGLLLLLYYRPTPNEAFESVQYIVTRVQFGWLIRSVHSWSANLMVFTACVHMISVFFLGSYRKPRETTWLTGILLLFLVLGFGFSGYLLPWNTLAYFATKVGTSVSGQVPVVGKSMLIFLRGGEDVTGATLSRFFALHVAILPLITSGLILAHLLLVQYHGMSIPPSVEKEWTENPKAVRQMRFFPHFLLREAMAWYVALAALGILAALWPWELGVKADPFVSAPAGIRPEWYFMFMFVTLKVIPSKVLFMDGEVLGILGFGVGALLLILVPFIEARFRHLGRWWLIGPAIFLLAYAITLTVYGYIPR